MINKKLQNVSLNGLVDAIFTSDQNTLTLCSTTLMNNDKQTQFASDEHKQNSSKTSDTILTLSFRTVLQVVK
ncbi:15576_t:CDS:2, partial [Funneliformis mosseae]